MLCPCSISFTHHLLSYCFQPGPLPTAHCQLSVHVFVLKPDGLPVAHMEWHQVVWTIWSPLIPLNVYILYTLNILTSFETLSLHLWILPNSNSYFKFNSKIYPTTPLWIWFPLYVFFCSELCIVQQKMTLRFWSSCLHLLNAGTAGTFHYLWFLEY